MNYNNVSFVINQIVIYFRFDISFVPDELFKGIKHYIYLDNLQHKSI